MTHESFFDGQVVPFSVDKPQMAEAAIEQGAVLPSRTNNTDFKRLQRRVTHVEKKLVKKHEVLGVLLEEYVTLEKELGEPQAGCGCPRRLATKW